METEIRAEPLTPKGQRSRERIIEAALQLIRERGYQATTMQSICRAAGVATGTFYHYFKSKQDVILAYVQEENEAMLAYYQRLEKNSYTAALLRVLEYKISLYEIQGAEFIASMYNTLILSGEHFFDLHDYALMQILQDGYQQGQLSGEFHSSISSDFFCELAFSLFFSYTSLWCNSPENYPLREPLVAKFAGLFQMIAQNH